MQDSDWDDLRYFLAVTQAGTLSGAAAALGVNHSTVLRRLGRLEQHMGVRLFDRLASGYTLTPAGALFNERLRAVGDAIDSARRPLKGLDLQLSGSVRITSTDTLARSLLMPLLAEFRQQHPGIQLQVTINNHFLNLTQREADVALRPTNRPPDNLIGRRVGAVQTAIYAAKSYRKKHRDRIEWAAHEWVAPDEALAHLEQAKWLRKHTPPQRIAASVDSLSAMVEAVKSGLGAGLLLCLLGDAEKNLVRLSEPLAELDTAVWVLTHPDIKQVARIKALTDFLYEKLSASPALIHARKK